MKKNTLLFSLALLCSVGVAGQVGFGGTPPSFRYARTEGVSIEKIAAPFERRAQIAKDEAHQAETGTPPKIAVQLPVHYTPSNSGTWTTLPDGNAVWRLRLQAEGALALILSYDDFLIPDGAKLFIYNGKKNQVLGAYTYATHPEGGAFSTEMVAGDEATLELVIPADRPELKEAVRLVISGLGYCYNYVHVENENALYMGESGACHVNINCEEGAAWQTEKTGVAQMTMLKGKQWYVCSGTMINNTSQDLTPYLLSAFHCLGQEDLPQEDLAKWQFKFHYESPGCENEEPKTTKTLVGCHVRVAIPVHNGSDGLLLELDSSVPEDWGVYFNGWDRRGEILEGGGVGIHHPKGDIKKISTYKKYGPSTWDGEMGPGAKDAHWMFSFVQTKNGHGITEGGSSGSPLFGSDHLVIGTLTGGNSSCTYTNGLNYYGRLWYHWDQYGDSPTTQMKTWLDPLNSDAKTLQGTFFNPVAPRIKLGLKELDLTGTVGADNPEKSVNIECFNLTENVTATAEGFFEVSADGESWAATALIGPKGGKLHVRYAPAIYGNHEGRVVLDNPELKNKAAILLQASSCREISIDSSLPNADINTEYSAQLSSHGSDGPFSYVIVEGQLPEGLTMDEAGNITGTVREDGIFDLQVEVTDKYGCSSIGHVGLYVKCDVVDAFPFKEDFEADTALACWQQQMEKGSVVWQYDHGVSADFEDVTTAFHGERNAVFTDKSYDSNTTLLLTPQLDFTGFGRAQVDFYYLLPAWESDIDELRVLYRLGAHDTWRELATYDTDMPTWTKASVMLPEVSDETFVAFEATARYGYGVAIDSLTIQALPGTGVEEQEVEQTNFRFANPVRDGSLEMSWDGMVKSIAIYSVSGKMVYSVRPHADFRRMVVDTSLWECGFYILRVETDKGESNYKLFNN